MAIGREAFGRGAQMLWAQRRAGRLRRLQHSRLAALVAHARDCSPLYRDLYAGLPWSPDLAALPAVDKRVLNGDFDAWVCDARLTRSGVEEFLADPGRFGQPYLDEYFVCTSSGTTGRPGLFVHDRHACAVYLGMFGRLDATWLSWRDFARMELRGDRVAAVVGTGGHFAGASWVQFMRTVNPRWRRSWKLVSAQWPTDRIVAELNAHDPAIVLIYPSSLLQLLVPRERGADDLPAVHRGGREAMSQGPGSAPRRRSDVPCERCTAPRSWTPSPSAATRTGSTTAATGPFWSRYRPTSRRRRRARHRTRCC